MRRVASRRGKELPEEHEDQNRRDGEDRHIHQVEAARPVAEERVIDEQGEIANREVFEAVPRPGQDGSQVEARVDGQPDHKVVVPHEAVAKRWPVEERDQRGGERQTGPR
ncbi:MAG: hypothetical protein GY937_25130 [bacterium]|nr:hypothetical protein [bacterium]